MSVKKIGPKGQVLIPKPIRDALGLHPGVEVIIKIRGDEVVLSRPKIEGNYTEYYVSTRSPKLKKTVDIKKIIIEEFTERHGIH